MIGLKEKKAWKWNSTNEDWDEYRKQQKRNRFYTCSTRNRYQLCSLIIGKDLIYRDGKVLVDPNEYFDKFGKPKKIKTEIADLMIQ